MTVTEMPGRTADGETRSRKYIARGYATEDAAITAVAAVAPNSLDNITRSDIRITEESSQDDWYKCEVIWSKQEKDEPEQLTAEFRFSFAAKSDKITQSIRTVSSHAKEDEEAPDFKGAINVVNESGKLKVEGVDLPVPPETFSWRFTIPQSDLLRYGAYWEELAGKTNRRPWRQHSAHSLLIVRISGGATSNDNAEVEFGFAMQRPQVNIPVGDIVVPSKRGMDLLWVYYEPDEDENSNTLIMPPRAVYVEEVYKSGEYANLGF